MTGEAAFVSTEVATIWHYLRQTIERMSDIAADVSTQELHWNPPAPDANSIAVLLVHTMANIEENVLAVVAGEPMNRDRDAEFVENGLTGSDLGTAGSVGGCMAIRTSLFCRRHTSGRHRPQRIQLSHDAGRLHPR